MREDKSALFAIGSHIRRQQIRFRNYFTKRKQVYAKQSRVDVFVKAVVSEPREV